MARRTVVDCDRCGKANIDPVNLRLETGIDNGYAKVVVIPEICISCSAAILNSIAKDFSHERAAKLHEEIKAYKKTIGVR
jgi:hypothetical protein